MVSWFQQSSTAGFYSGLSKVLREIDLVGKINELFLKLCRWHYSCTKTIYRKQNMTMNGKKSIGKSFSWVSDTFSEN